MAPIHTTTTRGRENMGKEITVAWVSDCVLARGCD